MTSGQVVLLFPSASHALRAEKVLKAAGVAVKLVPVPRHLSSDCGVCARLAAASLEEAERALAAGGVQVEAVHPL